MWKFHDFPITQILREINFGESISSKTAVFAFLGGSEFCQFGKFQPSKSAKFRASMCVTMADFAFLKSLKLI